MLRLVQTTTLLFILAGAAACGAPEPPPLTTTRYPLSGQILVVNAERKELTVKHGDIDNLMPGMTMSFPVVDEKDLVDRVPGELITATLEVTGGQGRLADVVRTGTAPLPSNTNEVALASGILEVGNKVPDAALIDQTDRRRSLAEWSGMPMLVGFVYTTCPLPNYCPLIDRQFATLQARIAADAALAGKVRLVSISIDPTHDTPAILATHAATLEADPAVWTFLTGDAMTVDRVAGRYGVGIVRPEAGGEISHNLRTTLVGRDGTVRAIYTGNEWSLDDVLRDIRAAVAAN